MAKRKSSRGRVLVNAKGRKYKKNIEAFEKSIMDDPNLNELQKRAKIADLRDHINDKVRENKSGWGKKLTTNGFEGWEAKTDLERMFANVGMSAEEIADMYGWDENELLDPDNWNGSTFVPGGKTFKFSYTGEIFS